MNYSTVRRWTITGQKGLILEFILIGNRKFTTAAALQRFCNALTRQELQAMKWAAELMRPGNEDLEERMRRVAAELNAP